MTRIRRFIYPEQARDLAASLRGAWNPNREDRPNRSARRRRPPSLDADDEAELAPVGGPRG